MIIILSSIFTEKQSQAQVIQLARGPAVCEERHWHLTQVFQL